MRVPEVSDSYRQVLYISGLLLLARNPALTVHSMGKFRVGLGFRVLQRSEQVSGVFPTSLRTLYYDILIYSPSTCLIMGTRAFCNMRTTVRSSKIPDPQEDLESRSLI